MRVQRNHSNHMIELESRRGSSISTVGGGANRRKNLVGHMLKRVPHSSPLRDCARVASINDVLTPRPCVSGR